jgi:predicted RND superfamily exporter protein
MIAVVMMLVLRSVRAGFLSMLPNIFPVVVIFGTMGWINVMVDIGTMMTASVAMGIAVDDTIHFLTWFRRGLDQGQSRQRAILLAYQRVGTAMVQTTAIGGLGLSIFALSTFTPTQRFGTLMLAMLMAALVGDLVFLPALLASPLGRVFRTRQAIPDSSPSQFAPHIPVSAQPGASPTQSSQSRSENDAAFTRVRPDVALGT